MPLKGIDVYWRNPDLSADQLMSAGLSFLISKATQYLASYSLDAKYQSRKALAISLGLPFGAYAFGDGIDGGIQADHFLKMINPQGDMALWLDLEANMTLSQAEAFVNWIKKYTGIWPGWYSNWNYVTNVLQVPASSPLITECPFWFAGDPQADGTPNLPDVIKNSGNLVLWQHSPSALLGLDTDYFAGDITALKTLFQKLAGTYNQSAFKSIHWNVPYVSQWADEAAATTYEYRDDCGPAALAGLFDYFGIAHPDLGTLDSLTSLAKNDIGLYPADLAMLAAMYGLTLTSRIHTSIDDLNTALQSVPVIVMVNMLAVRAFALPAPVQDTTALLHFLTVTGFDGTNYTVNDPDRWGAGLPGGKDFVIPADALIAGLNQMVMPGQILIPTPPSSAPIPTGGIVASQLEVVVDTDVKGTYIRSTGHYDPSGLNIGGSIKNGDSLTVDLSTLNAEGYVKIVGGEFNGRWIKQSETAQPAGHAPTVEYDDDPNGTWIRLTGHFPSPGETDNRVGSVSLDDEVDIDETALNAEGYARIIGGKYDQRWIKLAELTKVKPPNAFTPPSIVVASAPPSRPSTSLYGLHSYGNGGKTILTLIQRLKAAGVRLAGVTVLRQYWQDELTPSQIKAIDPGIAVVERAYPAQTDASNLLQQARVNWNWKMDNLYDVGAKAYQLYKQHFPIDRAADWIQIINEPVIVNTAATLSFWRGARDAAHADGVKLAVICAPYFWPALPGESRNDGADTKFWTNPDTDAFMGECIRYGDLLSLHEYIYPDPGGAWDAGPMLRHEQGITYLSPANRAVKIGLTEWGTGKGATIPGAAYVQDVEVGEAKIRAGIANIAYLGGWVVGPYGQDVSDLSNDINTIEAWLKTVKWTS